MRFADSLEREHARETRVDLAVDHDLVEPVRLLVVGECDPAGASAASTGSADRRRRCSPSCRRRSPPCRPCRRRRLMSGSCVLPRVLDRGRHEPAHSRPDHQAPQPRPDRHKSYARGRSRRSCPELLLHHFRVCSYQRVLGGRLRCAHAAASSAELIDHHLPSRLSRSTADS